MWALVVAAVPVPWLKLSNRTWAGPGSWFTSRIWGRRQEWRCSWSWVSYFGIQKRWDLGLDRNLPRCLWPFFIQDVEEWLWGPIFSQHLFEVCLRAIRCSDTKPQVHPWGREIRPSASEQFSWDSLRINKNCSGTQWEVNGSEGEVEVDWLRERTWRVHSWAFNSTWFQGKS